MIQKIDPGNRSEKSIQEIDLKNRSMNSIQKFDTENRSKKRSRKSIQKTIQQIYPETRFKKPREYQNNLIIII